MKPINLYDIYRKVSKRTRSSKSPETRIKAEAMRLAAENILNNPTLKRVVEFRKAEHHWLHSPDVSSSSKLFADQFEDAIRSDWYFVERSHFDPNGINARHRTGIIYCAQSSSKPGQLKLGFTTMKLQTRLQKMTTKHGIGQARPLFAITVERPAMIESQIKKKLRDCLVAGSTCGGSNEWYSSSAIKFARSVVESIEESDCEILKAALYDGCPNAKSIKLALQRLGNEVASVS